LRARRVHQAPGSTTPLLRFAQPTNRPRGPGGDGGCIAGKGCRRWFRPRAASAGCGGRVGNACGCSREGSNRGRAGRGRGELRVELNANVGRGAPHPTRFARRPLPALRGEVMRTLPPLPAARGEVMRTLPPLPALRGEVMRTLRRPRESCSHVRCP
jgi:hypothetical protein